jgi:hypothetical protein
MACCAGSPTGWNLLGLVDARFTAGGHADPTEVLRWLQGDASDPLGLRGRTSAVAVLQVLVDRRHSLAEEHTRKVSQLHHLLLELIPGGAKKDLSAAQAKKLLATVRPRDAAGKARRRVAAELIADLERIHSRRKAADTELRELVMETGRPCWTCPASAPPVLPGCSSRSATSPAFPTAATSPPGTAPPPSTPPPATTSAIGSPGPATARSTAPCT